MHYVHAHARAHTHTHSFNVELKCVVWDGERVLHPLVYKS